MIALEVFIPKDDGIIWANPTVDLTEPPTIELARKACKLGRLEVEWNHVSREIIAVANHKGFAIFEPGYTEIFPFGFTVAHHVH